MTLNGEMALNEVGFSLFRYFVVGLRVCDIVVKKFTFAISSPDEFLSTFCIAFCICVVGGVRDFKFGRS